MALQDGTYQIVPETEGSYLDEAGVIAAVETAVDNGEVTVNLEESGCYEEPKVRSDSSALKAEAAVKNKYSSISVTYQMGCGITETLDAQTTAGWFTFDENIQPVLDENWQHLRGWTHWRTGTIRSGRRNRSERQTGKRFMWRHARTAGRWIARRKKRP